MDTLTRDTAKSYLWNQVAVVFDGLTLMAVSVLVGRLAGREALGLFGWVISVVGFVSLAAALGMKESAAVLAQRAGGQALGSLFRKYLAVRAGAAFLAAAVTASVLAHAAGWQVALAAALYVFALLCANLFSAFDVAIFKTKAVAAGKIVLAVVSLSVAVVGARAGSVALVLAGLALGALVGGVVYMIPLRRLVSAAPGSPPSAGLFELPLTLWLVGLANFLVGAQGAPMILKTARFAENEIALLIVGLHVAVIANRALLGGFANVILASFSRAAVGESGALARMHSLYVRVSAIGSLPLLFGVLVFAPFLARVWLAGDVTGAARVARILALWFLAGRLVGGGAHSTALYSSGLHRAGLALRAAGAVVAACATFAAALRFGITGAAVASGAGGFAVVAAEWALLYVRRRIGLPWKVLAKLALAGTLAAAPAWALTRLGGAFFVSLAAVIFCVAAAAAVVVVRPLLEGEAESIGGGSYLGRALRILEKRPAPDRRQTG